VSVDVDEKFTEEHLGKRSQMTRVPGERMAVLLGLSARWFSSLALVTALRRHVKVGCGIISGSGPSGSPSSSMDPTEHEDIVWLHTKVRSSPHHPNIDVISHFTF